MIRATCVCGNTSSFDEKSLEGSTIEVNGTDIVLCCDCEDELLRKLALRKGIGIHLTDEGLIVELDVGYNQPALKLNDGYKVVEE